MDLIMDIKLSIDVSDIAKSAERALFEEAKRRTEGTTRNLFRSKQDCLHSSKQEGLKRIN